MAETRTTSSTGGQKGTKLARHDLIPPGPLTALAEHYGRGARKYANHQWRKGYEWSKSYAAMIRHATLWNMGFDYDVCSNDPEGCSFVDADGNPYEPDEPDTCFNHTGSHHMAAVAWHAFLLLEFKDAHPEHDDRYRPEVPDDDPEDGSNGFPARVWVGPAKLLPEDGWEEVGYTSLEDFDLSSGTHDSPGVLDIDLSGLFKPQTFEVELKGGTLEMIQALYGIFNRPARFEASPGGTRDLENPLPKDVEQSIDDGWTLLDLMFGKWFLAAPHALEIPIPDAIRLNDVAPQPPFGYVTEYRIGLGIDSVGGVL